LCQNGRIFEVGWKVPHFTLLVTPTCVLYVIMPPTSPNVIVTSARVLGLYSLEAPARRYGMD